MAKDFFEELAKAKGYTDDNMFYISRNKFPEQSYRCIKGIYAENSNLSNEMLVSYFDGLTVSTLTEEIEFLVFENCQFGRTQFLLSGILQNFPSPSSTKWLRISCCNELSNLTIEKIAILIEQNSLEYLDLSRMKLTQAQVTLILKALKENTALKELNLSGTGINNAHLNQLLSVLRSNKTLKYLDLSRNDLTLDDINSLLRTLEENKTLTHFELDAQSYMTNKLPQDWEFIPVSHSTEYLQNLDELGYGDEVLFPYDLGSLESNQRIVSLTLPLPTRESYQNLKNALERNEKISLEKKINSHAETAYSPRFGFATPSQNSNDNLELSSKNTEDSSELLSVISQQI